MTAKEYNKMVKEIQNPKEITLDCGIQTKNYGKIILIPKAIYEEIKSTLNETKYKKTITEDYIRFDLLKEIK